MAKVPKKAGSVAALQYELLVGKPYKLTSDDALSAVAAKRKGIGSEELVNFRQEYFSKGQPCFRASPLTKTHGWALHSDQNGFVALLAPDSPEIQELLDDDKVKKIHAMRSKRA